jgi:dTDP-6-deoxy-L-talose 4-dehydrogenase (NAD+)
MKILVTGATGFIGYHVIHYLLDNKFEIIATSSSRERAKNKDWFNQVSFIEQIIGIKTEENLFQKFGQPDILIHLSWEGLPDYKNLIHVEKVLPAHYAFLENMIRNGLSNLTVTGTCFEYGMKTGCFTETMTPEPGNPYARAKDELRKQLEDLQAVHSFSFKWVRLFYMYGKGQNPGSVLALLDSALSRGDEIFNMSGGQQVRDYLPVEEVAANIVHIAVQNKVTGVINCCSNAPITIEKLVTNHIKKSGKSIQLNLGYYPYPDYEPMEFWGDDRKLKIALEDR